MIQFVDSEFARQCIQDNNLLRVDTIRLFGQGFDNFAFLVNEKYIFRFPKTDEANQLLNDENRVLPYLKDLISLQIPYILFQGSPTENYPYRFHGYEMVQGKSAYQVALSEKELKDSLPTLAHFLVKLHGIKASHAQMLGAQHQLYDEITIQRVIESLRKRVRCIQKKRIVQLDDRFILRSIEQSKNIRISHDKDCLVHGDLDIRHLLFQNKKLIGVIDWGDIGINHPVVDYAVVHLMFPKSMHHIFLEIYGFIEPDIWVYARFLALHRSITLILHGHDIQDLQLLEAAKKSYTQLLDESMMSV